MSKPAVEPTTTVRGVWWLSPVGGVLLAVVPTLIVAAAIPDGFYRQAWDTPKYLTTASAAMWLLAMGLFSMASIAALLMKPRADTLWPWPGLSGSRHADLLRASGVLFWLTILGYLAFAVIGLARGVTVTDLVGAFTSQDNLSGTLKAKFEPVAGVTTFTQLGIAYAIAASLVLVHHVDGRVVRRLVIVVGLAGLRSFLVTERLALLEVLIPIAVVFAMRWAGDPRAWIRRGVNFLPVVLVPLLVMLFAVFEYSRSWVFFRANSGGSFADFALQRFAGYYATAYNNGQLGLLYDHLPRRLPLYTLDAFWTAPGIEQLHLYQRLSPGSAEQQFTLLTQMGNPELNSYGGISAAFIDWGTIGGLLWWTLAGLVLGIAYRGFTNGSLIPLLVFPALATGVFEIPRYIYWTQGRLFPAILALLLAAGYMSEAGRRVRADLRRASLVAP